MNKARYTEDQIKFMVESYTSAADKKSAVQKIANELDRSVQSVIAKLAREGVYQKQTATTKAGAPIIKKQEYVRGIEIMLSAKNGELSSLEKASKQDLERMMKLLTSMSDNVNVRGK